MTTVLVTGANGHVGANTVRSLLARGHEAVAMVRESSDVRGLAGLDLEFRYADVLDAEAVQTAMEGCEAVVHCAAVYAAWAKDVNDIMEPCVSGTHNVFMAARDAGVGRIVYTSSIAAVGYSTAPDLLRTADDWNEDAQLAYIEAKTQSERDAVRLAEETGIDTVRLCPAFVMGPWDYRVTPSMKALAQDMVDGLGFTFEGGVNLVHACDVGEIHARAVEMGKPGGRYIVGGENVSVPRIGELVHKWTGVRPPYLPVPRALALASGSVLGALSKVTGRAPLFSREMAYEQVKRYAYYDCDETNRVFDLSPRSADECLRDAMRWLLYVGAIKRTLPPDAGASLSPDPAWVNV